MTEPEHRPVSSEWARRAALEATAEAVRKAKDSRKKPATPADTEEPAR